MNLVWFYIQSSIEIELNKNRAAVTASVRAGERDFLIEYWYPRERQFIYFYIKKDPNLDCNNTQRAKSTYLVTTILLNH